MAPQGPGPGGPAGVPASRSEGQRPVLLKLSEGF